MRTGVLSDDFIKQQNYVFFNHSFSDHELLKPKSKYRYRVKKPVSPFYDLYEIAERTMENPYEGIDQLIINYMDSRPETPANIANPFLPAVLGSPSRTVTYRSGGSLYGLTGLEAGINNLNLSPSSSTSVVDGASTIGSPVPISPEIISRRQNLNQQVSWVNQQERMESPGSPSDSLSYVPWSPSQLPSTLEHALQAAQSLPRSIRNSVDRTGLMMMQFPERLRSERRSSPVTRLKDIFSPVRIHPLPRQEEEEIHPLLNPWEAYDDPQNSEIDFEYGSFLSP